MTTTGPVESNFQYLLRVSKINPTAAVWYNLGHCYFKGDGCNKNLLLASYCFFNCIGLNKNHVYALNNLGTTFFIRGANEIHRKKLSISNYIEANDPLLQNAFKNYKTAVEINPLYARAWYNLGNCYEFGYGTSKNLQQAFSCYKQATLCGICFSPAWAKLYTLSIKEITMDQHEVDYFFKMSQKRDPAIKDGLIKLSEKQTVSISSNSRSQQWMNASNGLKKIRISGLSDSESCESDFLDTDTSASEDSLQNGFANLTINYKKTRKNAATCPTLPPPRVRSELSGSLPSFDIKNQRVGIDLNNIANFGRVGSDDTNGSDIGENKCKSIYKLKQ
ncbi:MAG: sel1 repeat family protein [Proteobacteria bacterium]|nr:sel1 repeat family protein [Pseudomonadota bacterium]